MLIELFSLGRTAEAQQAIICSKSAISLQQGPVGPKFQIEGVATTHHSSQKTRLNDISHGTIKIWTDFSSVLSQCTRLTEDRRIDGQTEISSLDRVCIPCSAVKIVHKHGRVASISKMTKLQSCPWVGSIFLAFWWVGLCRGSETFPSILCCDY